MAALKNAGSRPMSEVGNLGGESVESMENS